MASFLLRIAVKLQSGGQQYYCGSSCDTDSSQMPFSFLTRFTVGLMQAQTLLSGLRDGFDISLWDI